jgi:hypothetical protein
LHCFLHWLFSLLLSSVLWYLNCIIVHVQTNLCRIALVRLHRYFYYWFHANIYPFMLHHCCWWALYLKTIISNKDPWLNYTKLKKTKKFGCTCGKLCISLVVLCVYPSHCMIKIVPQLHLSVRFVTPIDKKRPAVSVVVVMEDPLSCWIICSWVYLTPTTYITQIVFIICPRASIYLT